MNNKKDDWSYKPVVKTGSGKYKTIILEPKHLQKYVPDPEPLQFPRPDRTENAVAKMLPLNPFRFTASSTTVTVFEPDHGRSSSDTVRFRDVRGSIFGASVTELEDSDGYSITKTDDDFYTFTVSTAPGTTGNGGGGYASAGPATLSN